MCIFGIYCLWIDKKSAEPPTWHGFWIFDWYDFLNYILCTVLDGRVSWMWIVGDINIEAVDGTEAFVWSCWHKIWHTSDMIVGFALFMAGSTQTLGMNDIFKVRMCVVL